MRRHLITLLLLLALTPTARATETENLGISVLPAPGRVTVDGKWNDWDLSGGIFCCGDVERQRDKLAVWVHAMYDAQFFYVLARWIDETPMNNPGQVAGSYGFQGDCLQFRTITAAGTPQERGNHFTCWRDRDGRDVIFVERGTDFKAGTIKDAKTVGARQAFLKNADGKGYVQEIAIPWNLLTMDGRPLTPGGKMVMTVEPNFTVGGEGRSTIKDLFKAGVVPDRVFTFMASSCWGIATLEPKGNVAPRPLRLADARELPIRMVQGVPSIDWTGLAKTTQRKGLKNFAFTMPEDGYVSLQVRSAGGEVVSQLLSGAFRKKGQQEIPWDGLTTTNWRTPGQPVPAGTYTTRGLWHRGIGLRLKGWAANAGSAPWDSSPTSNWGGDHGVPVTAAAAGSMVFLGWSGAEAGKALVACDLDGNVLWKNSRQGMAGAEFVAVDGDKVYAANWGTEHGNYLYRLDTATGAYAQWENGTPDLTIGELLADAPNRPNRIDGLAAGHGELYLSLRKPQSGAVAVVDAAHRKLLHCWPVPQPGQLCVAARPLVYVVSGGTSVLALDTTTGQSRTIVAGLRNATGIAADGEGKIYVAVRDPDNQIKVFSRGGQLVRTIGRPGGRRLLGPWQADGMAFAQGIAVDSAGKVWVTEADMFPKRISVWAAGTGKFAGEFFGPTTYGAVGGAIDPLDPNIMAGMGCEWHLDPHTGRAACTSVITRDGMQNSRFALGSNGRLYLAVAPGWAYDGSDVRIFERCSDGQYKLRAMFQFQGRDQACRTRYWADENGDGRQQSGEITEVNADLHFSGWYMQFAPDLTIYAGNRQLRVVGFTACGAPKYDLVHPVRMPEAGLGSADGRRMLTTGAYGEDATWMTCYDIGSGRKLWSYPDNFVGVHGSHKACPPTEGMIRGSFGPCGTVKLPPPIGNVWVLATNVGEWHIITEDGCYLTRLFQGDPMQVRWPAKAVPGAVMDDTPPGMGGEDFGGSICGASDGRLYLQAGKTGFWNLEVVGLDTVQPLAGSSVALSAQDVREAERLRGQTMQQAVGVKRLAVRKRTAQLNGNFDADIPDAEVITFQKQPGAEVRAKASWDDRCLYLSWDVRDATPWLNAAALPEQMYLYGDTVDFQLATDPGADKHRDEAARGDLRLSIGSFHGQPTAVLYRRVSDAKKPKRFSSGIVKDYAMDYVAIVADARIKIALRPGSGYCVTAAIPLPVLGLTPREGLILKADFGVTHGGPDNQRTRLRTYWNNQETGIVDDAVFELKMTPRNWGEIEFKP